jgi:hypothetical protein
VRSFIFGIAALLALPVMAMAEDVPRTPDGKPDLNGVWDRPYVPDMSRGGNNQQGPGKLPFTPWGEDNFKSYDVSKFDYTAHCLPQGLTRSMNSPFPIEIFQTAKRVAVLFEAWNVFHVIPTDGRGFPKNLEPTWMGTSIGKWDGDTLVVETTGFNAKTKLDTVGHPLTEQLRVTERYTRTDAKHISYEVTINDPKAYTTPWKNVRTFTLRPDWEIMEYSCEENNRDLTEGHLK